MSSNVFGARAHSHTHTHTQPEDEGERGNRLRPRACPRQTGCTGAGQRHEVLVAHVSSICLNLQSWGEGSPIPNLPTLRDFGDANPISLGRPGGKYAKLDQWPAGENRLKFKLVFSSFTDYSSKFPWRSPLQSSIITIRMAKQKFCHYEQFTKSDRFCKILLLKVSRKSVWCEDCSLLVTSNLSVTWVKARV